LIDEKFLDEATEWIPEHVSILVVDSAWISDLVGFHFHRGYLACGRRPAPRLWTDDVANSIPESTAWTGAYLIAVQDPENMGSILRSCAAFGIADILIGPECVDPFARRVLRVSMGNAFKLRFCDAPDPHRVIQQLKDRNVQSVAACLRHDSIGLTRWHPGERTLVLLGNEAHGLPGTVLDIVDQRIKIRMEMGTDSLNVSVAAGIFLHHTQRWNREET
jgi:tRNA G18 (ribose-2'-O)-methylase SpoU